jgi:hypothetical protein
VTEGELGELRIVADQLVQPVLHIEPLRDAALQEVPPLGREPPALRRDPDHGRRRVEAERVVHGADDRDARLYLACAPGVEDRDDRRLPVANDPPCGLPVVGIRREVLSEDQVTLLGHEPLCPPAPGRRALAA